MGTLGSLAYGFSVLFTPTNLLAVFVGAVTGTFIGVLPGIGPMATMAILLPITFAMKPETALIMLAGVFYGSMYGGSTTSILMNVPGEVSSIATCTEGYQMAKRGRAGAALAIAAIGSFIAGTLGLVILMVFAPTVARFALSFGSPEFFAIALLGLFTLSRISGGPFWQSLMVLGFGMAVATVGLDPVSGWFRYTFHVTELMQGINLVPVVMGLYGVGEVLSVAEQGSGLPHIQSVRLRELMPTRAEWKRSWPAIWRGSATGFFFGLIPGPAPVISTFFSYRLEKRLSKHPQEWGKGAIEGVAGPESANNAASSSAMIPLLSLGIPFTPGTAMLLAALLIHGVQTGPLLISQRPEIFWGVVASMYIGNVALLVLNLPLVGLWVSLLRVPQSILMALILLLVYVGAYSLNNSLFDLIVLTVMGIIGYLFRKVRFDASPLVVALVLGPMLERSLTESLSIGLGNPLVFFQRPISGSLLGILVLMLVLPLIWQLVTKSRHASAD